MARVEDSANGSFLLRSMAVGAAVLVMGVGGFGVLTALKNSDRLTRMEAQIEIAETIEEGFQRLERAIRETR